MTSWAPLDVAIGLVLVYFLLSLIASVVNEGISTALGWRAKYLERWLMNVLADAKNDDGEDPVTRFFRHPLVCSTLPQPGSLWVKNRKERRPSYVTCEAFSAAVLSGLEGATKLPATVEDAIENLPGGQLKAVARSLVDETTADVEELRAKLERWYDDSMERVSGWYKRRVQMILLFIGLGLAIVLNADTLQVVQSLWADKTIRAAVVAEADSVSQTGSQLDDLTKVADQVKQIKSLDVPLGWRFEDGDPRDLPGSTRTWFGKVIGILLTAAALTLGAPFWFDLLSKVSRVRFAGAPPPVRGGIRIGEGEQRRAGPSYRTSASSGETTHRPASGPHSTAPKKPAADS